MHGNEENNAGVGVGNGVSRVRNAGLRGVGGSLFRQNGADEQADAGAGQQGAEGEGGGAGDLSSLRLRKHRREPRLRKMPVVDERGLSRSMTTKEMQSVRDQALPGGRARGAVRGEHAAGRPDRHLTPGADGRRVAHFE